MSNTLPTVETQSRGLVKPRDITKGCAPLLPLSSIVSRYPVEASLRPTKLELLEKKHKLAVRRKVQQKKLQHEHFVKLHRSRFEKIDKHESRMKSKQRKKKMKQAVDDLHIAKLQRKAEMMGFDKQLQDESLDRKKEAAVKFIYAYKHRQWQAKHDILAALREAEARLKAQNSTKALRKELKWVNVLRKKLNKQNDVIFKLEKAMRLNKEASAVQQKELQTETAHVKHNQLYIERKRKLLQKRYLLLAEKYLDAGLILPKTLFTYSESLQKLNNSELNSKITTAEHKFLRHLMADARKLGFGSMDPTSKESKRAKEENRIAELKEQREKSSYSLQLPHPAGADKIDKSYFHSLQHKETMKRIAKGEKQPLEAPMDGSLTYNSHIPTSLRDSKWP